MSTTHGGDIIVDSIAPFMSNHSVVHGGVAAGVGSRSWVRLPSWKLSLNCSFWGLNACRPGGGCTLSINLKNHKVSLGPADGFPAISSVFG